MYLPFDSHLPVGKLAAVFNNTSATYKFYWLLAILESLKKDTEIIYKKELFARMVTQPWYTVNYFRLSFGPQDLIHSSISKLQELHGLKENASKGEVLGTILHTTDKETDSILWHFDKNVPFKFLSPWCGTGSASEIMRRSQDESTLALYALHKDSIKIHPEWKGYLMQNSKVLRDFIHWNLTLFLQKRNPNIPDISGKLIKPAVRNSLGKQRQLWKEIIERLGSIECIYTGKLLTGRAFDLDHFIPYSFVSHDQLWNLIPGDPSFNRSKNSKLPLLEKHFEKYFNLQSLALEVALEINPKNKLLEDYFTVSKNFDKGLQYDQLYETVHPLITIAHNNGFSYLS